MPRFALAATALVLACGKASADLLSIVPGSGIARAGSGAGRNNGLGGASGGKSIAFAYLSCLTSKSCASTTPSDRVLFALDDGRGSPDDNDFDDSVGYMVATALEKPITTSAIPAVPLPAAFWLLGSAFLGLVGLGRRRAH